MIAIIDYDCGNVLNVQHAFEKLGKKSVITRDPTQILTADHIVMPGVGNFGEAVTNIRKFGLEEPINSAIKANIPFLGICVGMQILFEDSEESPDVPGLGILKGHVKRFPDKAGYKVPQIGWNSIFMMNKGDLFEGIPNGSFVYFVHSYYCEAENINQVKAVSEYMDIFHASVQKGNLFATQFHPEKSGDVGLQILDNFVHQKKDKEDVEECLQNVLSRVSM